MTQERASNLHSLTLVEEMPDQTAQHDVKSSTAISNDQSNIATPDEHMQDGVKQAEALTMAWTRKSLALAYAL